MDSNVLGNDHIKLYGGKTLWGQVGSGIVMDEPVQYEDTGGMYAQMIGEARNQFAVFKYEKADLVRGGPIKIRIAQKIDSLLGQPEYFSQFPYRRPVLK